MSKTYVEFPVTDRSGKERIQKAVAECFNCGYFYPDAGSDDPYYKCHYSDNEPSAWAPCAQQD